MKKLNRHFEYNAHYAFSRDQSYVEREREKERERERERDYKLTNEIFLVTDIF